MGTHYQKWVSGSISRNYFTSAGSRAVYFRLIRRPFWATVFERSFSSLSISVSFLEKFFEADDTGAGSQTMLLNYDYFECTTYECIRGRALSFSSCAKSTHSLKTSAFMYLVLPWNRNSLDYTSLNDYWSILTPKTRCLRLSTTPLQRSGGEKHVRLMSEEQVRKYRRFRKGPRDCNQRKRWWKNCGKKQTWSTLHTVA